jgi:type I restriction enzyme S subunit
LYEVFRIQKDKLEELCPEFLQMVFARTEFARYVGFKNWGSAREYFWLDSMKRTPIPVPSIKVQWKVVETWQGLRRMKEENEKLAEPLMQLCRSYLQECKKKYPMKELGNYIEQRLEINRDGMYGECDARGVNTNKEIQICKRMCEDLTSYKIVHPFDIVYNANIKLTKETTKFAVGLYAGEHNVIVTNFYTVFSIKQNELLPEYLLLILSNDEFARYVKFISCSSVRDRFDFSDMCCVKIPLPPIEVQQAIVDVYRCANEAKKIAEEADRLSREICPALVRWATEGGGE